MNNPEEEKTEPSVDINTMRKGAGLPPIKPPTDDPENPPDLVGDAMRKGAKLPEKSDGAK